MNQRVQDHAYIRARKNVKGMEIELMKKKGKKNGPSYWSEVKRPPT
jgi:hypothetical protein